MSQNVTIRPSASSMNRRQSLLHEHHGYRNAGTRLGEAVGGATAVCCCAPCGVVNFVYLAVCKVPLRLCLKALRRKRHRKLHSSESFPLSHRRCSCGCCDDIVGVRVYPMCSDDDDDVAVLKAVVHMEDKEVVELEKEMWDRFYSTGFWRSPSQKDQNFSSPRIVNSFSAPNFQVLTA
ncbi:hypothetical protein RJT34_23802 [Clitoria ternatea]|uniref:Uncharacterized protein n=1 Tax=Clitoria ternatea TaxID=43366 RepID=A0AAN9FPJ0_CLITE